MNYYTIKDAAMALGVTERWVQMLCKQNKIPGATRFNKQGAWLIPVAWVKTEQEKRCSEVNCRKKENNMKKIAFVFDDVSEAIGKEVLSELEGTGIVLHSTGMIPIYAHADEDTILSSLYSIIHEANMVIGISSSGNGIAIYTNKINGFTAAPIGSIANITEAIDIYSANAFDISAHNRDLVPICVNLIERAK